MEDLAQAVRAQIIRETAPKLAAKTSFTLRRLRGAALWGMSAAGALLIAVLASRGQVAIARLPDIFHPAEASQPTDKFDAKAETAKLAETVRGLALDGQRIKTRLAAVEHDLDDVTGSVSKQIEAADAVRRADTGPTVLGTATFSTAISAANSTAMPVSAGPAADTGAAPAVAPIEIPDPPPQIAYGVDIGSGLTLQALRARWTAIRSAHPQFFEGLEPIINVREIPRSNRIELRLVVGPLPQASAAEELCTRLTPFGLFCQPAIFDGQHLAVR